MALVWFVIRPEGVAQLFPGRSSRRARSACSSATSCSSTSTCSGAASGSYDSLMWWALLTPVYWMLMSYSGWRAFIQFFRDPFVWEKTQHGLVKKPG
jgi:glycosyltransferase XagB